MKLDQPFIRLPFAFDAEQLAKELNQLEAATWLPHPSGMKGNEALPLVSRNAQDNNDFDGPMAATKHLKASPYIQQCMQHIGEVYGRSRLMALAPGSEVSRHVDFNYHWYSRVRIHVPIVTNSKVIFHCGDESIHMQAGECWIFDSWRHHRVTNDGHAKRTHLVMDTAGSSRFWHTVSAVMNDQSAPPATPLQYTPNESTQVMTEKFNSSPIMAPGEMQALIEDLLIDLEANPNNATDTLNTLRLTLSDLVHDWRAVWSQFGQNKSGTPHYGALLQQTIARLPQEPRALTTKSNDIGATPIVMQRIIRAALRPELLTA